MCTASQGYLNGVVATDSFSPWRRRGEGVRRGGQRRACQEGLLSDLTSAASHLASVEDADTVPCQNKVLGSVSARS